MRKWAVIAGCICLVMVGRRAWGMTTDGTLITNVASGSFQSAGGIAFWISYSVTATVLVSNPSVSLIKTATPTVQSSGGTVTFRLWVVNTSQSSSAFNIIITDRLPDYMAYVGPLNPTVWRGNGLPLPLWTMSNSPTNGPGWNANMPGVGQAAPYYLRFALDFLGPSYSAYVEFIATVL